jgi:mRNA interferase HicA
VKVSEFKRWLKKLGCTFENGTKHTIVRLGDKFTAMPRHPSEELKTGTRHGILKELGIVDQSETKK